MPRSASKSGKGSKSSKTARVLSLLTDPSSAQDTAPVSDAADMSAGRTEEESIPVQRLDDKAAQEQIRDALVSELFGKKARPARPDRSAGQTRAAGDIPPRRGPFAAPDNEMTERLDPADETEILVKNGSQTELPQTDSTERLNDVLSRVPEDTAQSRRRPEPDRSAEPAVRSTEPAARSTESAPHAPESAVRSTEPASAPYTSGPAGSAHTPEAAGRPTAAPDYAAQEWDWRPPTVTPEKPESETLSSAAASSETRPAQAAPESRPVQVRIPAARPAPKTENDYICFNLTQALVEDKADKYMHLFGMCTCQRCKVDVTAIALSNLPSKYVATQSRDVIPLLSMYEGKYSAAVIAQVMSACKIVMSRPHHGRN